MKDNKTIEEIVGEFSRMSARKGRVNAGLCATCGSKSDHNEVTETGTFTHQFDYGVDARVWSEEDFLRQALHQYGESVREEIEQMVVKKMKIHADDDVVYLDFKDILLLIQAKKDNQ